MASDVGRPASCGGDARVWPVGEPGRPTRERVYGVVVAYGPDAEFSDRIRVFREQVGGLVIVDNKSAALVVERIKEIAHREGADLILNSENLGVATGLNQGAGEALRRGYRWALLLDQDSWPARNMREALGRIYDAYPAPERLAVIGAGYTERKPGGKFADWPVTQERLKPPGWQRKTTVISSGSLISLPAYQRLGRFRDDFFIDHVDDDYCLRARQAGWEVIESSQALMRHAIGRVTTHRFLGWRVETSNHEAIRRYYRARNCIVLALEYRRLDTRWVRYALSSLFKGTILMMLFEDRKLKKLLHVFRGLQDGWRRVKGPLTGAGADE